MSDATTKATRSSYVRPVLMGDGNENENDVYARFSHELHAFRCFHKKCTTPKNGNENEEKASNWDYFETSQRDSTNQSGDRRLARSTLATSRRTNYSFSQQNIDYKVDVSQEMEAALSSPMYAADRSMASNFSGRQQWPKQWPKHHQHSWLKTSWLSFFISQPAIRERRALKSRSSMYLPSS